MKAHLDANSPWPIVVIGTASNPMDDHHVLAYGYDDWTDGTSTLYIYDPNHHDKEAVWRLNFGGKTLVADEGISADANRGPIQGFFGSAYAPSLQPPLVTPLPPPAPGSISGPIDIPVVADDVGTDGVVGPPGPYEVSTTGLQPPLVIHWEGSEGTSIVAPASSSTLINFHLLGSLQAGNSYSFQVAVRVTDGLGVAVDDVKTVSVRLLSRPKGG